MVSVEQHYLIESNYGQIGERKAIYIGQGRVNLET